MKRSPFGLLTLFLLVPGFLLLGDLPSTLAEGGTGVTVPAFRPRGTPFTEVEGRATGIAVSPAGQAWMVQRLSGKVFSWAGNGWLEWPGIEGVMDIAIAPTGLPAVTKANGDIFKLDGSKWTKVDGFAHRIAYGGDGTLWRVGGGSPNKTLYRWRGADWERICDLPKYLTGFAVDQMGRYFYSEGGSNILRLKDTSFAMDSEIVNISAAGPGEVLVSTKSGFIWRVAVSTGKMTRLFTGIKARWMACGSFPSADPWVVTGDYKILRPNSMATMTMKVKTRSQGSYDPVWKGRGAIGGITNLSIWRPKTEPGFARLGDSATGDFNAPGFPSILIEDNPDFVKKPVDYVHIWTSNNFGGKDFYTSPRVKMFLNVDFKGDSWGAQLAKITSAWDCDSHSGWNDKVSSLQIYGPAKVEIFEHTNYRGSGAVLYGSVPDYTNPPACLSRGGKDWNDAMSSLHIRGDREVTPEPCHVWMPVPPPGYSALGCVVGKGFNNGQPVKPDLNLVRVVRDDLVVAGRPFGPIFFDSKSETNTEGSAYLVGPAPESPAHVPNTFLFSAKSDSFPEQQACVLRNTDAENLDEAIRKRAEALASAEAMLNSAREEALRKPLETFLSDLGKEQAKSLSEEGKKDDEARKKAEEEARKRLSAKGGELDAEEQAQWDKSLVASAQQLFLEALTEWAEDNGVDAPGSLPGSVPKSFIDEIANHLKNGETSGQVKVWIKTREAFLGVASKLRPPPLLDSAFIEEEIASTDVKLIDLGVKHPLFRNVVMHELQEITLKPPQDGERIIKGKADFLGVINQNSLLYFTKDIYGKKAFMILYKYEPIVSFDDLGFGFPVKIANPVFLERGLFVFSSSDFVLLGNKVPDAIRDFFKSLMGPKFTRLEFSSGVNLMGSLNLLSSCDELREWAKIMGYGTPLLVQALLPNSPRPPWQVKFRSFLVDKEFQCDPKTNKDWMSASIQANLLLTIGSNGIYAGFEVPMFLPVWEFDCSKMTFGRAQKNFLVSADFKVKEWSTVAKNTHSAKAAAKNFLLTSIGFPKADESRELCTLVLALADSWGKAGDFFYARDVAIVIRVSLTRRTPHKPFVSGVGLAGGFGIGKRETFIAIDFGVEYPPGSNFNETWYAPFSYEAQTSNKKVVFRPRKVRVTCKKLNLLDLASLIGILGGPVGAASLGAANSAIQEFVLPEKWRQFLDELCFEDLDLNLALGKDTDLGIRQGIWLSGALVFAGRRFQIDEAGLSLSKGINWECNFTEGFHFGFMDLVSRRLDPLFMYCGNAGAGGKPGVRWQVKLANEGYFRFSGRLPENNILTGSVEIDFSPDRTFGNIQGKLFGKFECDYTLNAPPLSEDLELAGEPIKGFLDNLTKEMESIIEKEMPFLKALKTQTFFRIDKTDLKMSFKDLMQGKTPVTLIKGFIGGKRFETSLMIDFKKETDVVVTFAKKLFEKVKSDLEKFGKGFEDKVTKIVDAAVASTKREAENLIRKADEEFKNSFKTLVTSTLNLSQGAQSISKQMAGAAQKFTQKLASELLPLANAIGSKLQETGRFLQGVGNTIAGWFR